MKASTDPRHGTLAGYTKLACRCEPCRKAGKTYRARNSERIREYGRKYRTVHQDEIREYWVKWYARNTEEHKAAAAKWRAENPEQAQGNSARYFVTHGDAIRDATAARRAKRYGLWVEHVDRSIVWERDSGICYLCGIPADPARWDLEHITPFTLGGEHSYANTAVAHPACNMRKGSRPLSEFTLPTESIEVATNKETAS